MSDRSDHLTPEQRSRNMAMVRGRNTRPEMQVRRALFRAGFRYRLHVRGLPGHPDIVLPRYHTVVFVHGCFWHGHGCRRSKRPASNRPFWDKKLDRNIERDRDSQDALREQGWNVAVIWGCSLETDLNMLVESLLRARSNGPNMTRNSPPA